MLVLGAWAGCGRPAGDGAETARGSPDGAQAPAPNDPRFHARLLEVAAEYTTYGNVDDAMHFAPTLCRRPPQAHIRDSASEDPDTHGRKLYWLYARDHQAYRKARTGAAQPVGQVLVKEAFVAEPGRGEADPQQGGWQPLVPVVDRDGKSFHAGAKHALFILLKLDPATEGTDEGWVYATVSPDGRTVTSAGRVASCMECHTAKTHDRMFGIE